MSDESGSLIGGDVTPNTGASLEGDSGAAANAESSSSAAGTSQGGEFVAPEWMSGFEVDSDLAMDPSLKAIQDVPSLIKSYVHAQRKMGADKTVLPNKNSTKEEWMQLYQKLGMPTDFNEYDLKAAEENAFKDEVMSEFKKTAFEHNVLPDQAQAMYDFLNNQAIQEATRMQEAQQQKLEEAITGLREEWGEAFDQNVHTAKLAVNEFGGDQLKQYLNDTGLGNDPNIIKVFNEIGKQFFKEDNFSAESKPAYSLSPAEAQQRINEITGDMNGPYYNSMHPDHKRIVEEVHKMFQIKG